MHPPRPIFFFSVFFFCLCHHILPLLSPSLNPFLIVSHFFLSFNSAEPLCSFYCHLYELKIHAGEILRGKRESARNKNTKTHFAFPFFSLLYPLPFPPLDSNAPNFPHAIPFCSSHLPLYFTCSQERESAEMSILLER